VYVVWTWVYCCSRRTDFQYGCPYGRHMAIWDRFHPHGVHIPMLSGIIFHPFAPPPLLGRFVPFLVVYVGSYRRRHQSSKSNFKSIASEVWGLRVRKNRVLPIDFDSRPYNSVTRYRAALWTKPSCGTVAFMVIQGRWFLCHKPICDFLSMINSNLSSFSHRFATIVHTDLRDHPR